MTESLISVKWTRSMKTLTEMWCHNIFALLLVLIWFYFAFEFNLVWGVEACPLAALQTQNLVKLVKNLKNSVSPGNPHSVGKEVSAAASMAASPHML